MLALEVALAGADPVPTMVFDEVDAGVGGRAAVEIGRRLARLATRHQVIVVTHLPQVAAYADRHLVVDKSRRGGGWRAAGVRTLDEDERIGRARPHAGRARRHRHRPCARRGAPGGGPVPPRRRPGPPPADAPQRVRQESPDGVGVASGNCRSQMSQSAHEAVRPVAAHAARAARHRGHRACRPPHRRAPPPGEGRARSPCSTRSTSTAPPPMRSSPQASWRVVNASPSISGRFPNLGPRSSSTRASRCWTTWAPGPAHDQGRQPRPAARGRRLRRGARARARRRAGRRVGRRRAGRGQGGPHPPIRGVRRQHHRVHAPGACPAARRGRHPRRRRRAGRTAGGRRRRRVRSRRRSRRALKTFIRDYRPVLVGVGAGADALRAAGHRPRLIVGDPVEISNEALTCGADIVVPAVQRRPRPGLAPRAGPRRERRHVPQHGQIPRTSRCCSRPTTARR